MIFFLFAFSFEGGMSNNKGMARMSSASSVASAVSTKSTASQVVASEPINSQKKFTVKYLGFVHVPGSDKYEFFHRSNL